MRTFLIASALCLATSPVLASDVFGVWKSEPNDEGAFIHVEIKPCANNANKVCGTIIKQVNSKSGRNVVGKPIIWDMVPDGKNEWDDGTIWAPDDDETYSSTMELKSANVLEVSGCVMGGLICRGQDWTRVK